MKGMEEIIEIPEGVSVSKQGESAIIKGPKGEVKRRFDNPKVDMQIKDGSVVLTSSSTNKRVKAFIKTYRAHLLNAFEGTQDPFIYKLKICAGHFPMNVSVSNNVLQIKNFLGEKIPRKVDIREGATVKVQGETITVQSPDKELAGQVAADIEQATRRPGFDTRIFQDGIYIVEKAGKVI